MEPAASVEVAFSRIAETRLLLLLSLKLKFEKSPFLFPDTQVIVLWFFFT